MLPRHAFGNTMLLSRSSCNVTMGRSFIRFVNRGVINQTQDPTARMAVVTYTIKKTLHHHAKPRERSGERREHWGLNNNCWEAGALLRITICLSFCAKGKETCKHSLRAFTPTTRIHATQSYLQYEGNCSRRGEFSVLQTLSLTLPQHQSSALILKRQRPDTV